MLVLASASPRRQELLRNADIAFTVQAANLSEVPFAGESAKDCAERLAGEKARAVGRARPHDFVLGADTIVVVDGLMLGKPLDPADAARMLGLLSGRAHQVITGVCLTGPGRSAGTPTFADTRSETTRVVMQPLTARDVASYVSSGEPMDKAGAYAIQGIASRWISRIEGDYFNVVGLPVNLVFRMLREHGSI
jgi:septum formation protein